MGHGRLVHEFVRRVEEPSHVVVFADSDHAGSVKHAKAHVHPNCHCGSHMLRSTGTTQGATALSWEMSEFYVLVKETSAGLGAVSELEDLGVDISKRTQIDKAVLEVRVDASAGRRHIATPTLWVEKLTQDGIVKITKSLEF